MEDVRKIRLFSIFSLNQLLPLLVFPAHRLSELSPGPPNVLNLTWDFENSLSRSDFVQFRERLIRLDMRSGLEQTKRCVEKYFFFRHSIRSYPEGKRDFFQNVSNSFAHVESLVVVVGSVVLVCTQKVSEEAYSVGSYVGMTLCDVNVDFYDFQPNSKYASPNHKYNDYLNFDYNYLPRAESVPINSTSTSFVPNQSFVEGSATWPRRPSLDSAANSRNNSRINPTLTTSPAQNKWNYPFSSIREDQLSHQVIKDRFVFENNSRKHDESDSRFMKQFGTRNFSQQSFSEPTSPFTNNGFAWDDHTPQQPHFQNDQNSPAEHINTPSPPIQQYYQNQGTYFQRQQYTEPYYQQQIGPPNIKPYVSVNRTTPPQHPFNNHFDSYSESRFLEHQPEFEPTETDTTATIVLQQQASISPPPTTNPTTSVSLQAIPSTSSSDSELARDSLGRNNRVREVANSALGLSIQGGPCPGWKIVCGKVESPEWRRGPNAYVMLVD
ncbi:hypothetical protein HK096_008525 [Nowakowskiella sp. JEL0078]|nr:hypothetical protein HK096_008525 [Nowakowskiella sp. JEL0078]